MYAVLDLDWVPSEATPKPGVGHAPAIVRDDHYELQVTLVDGDSPFPLTGSIAAQVRRQKLRGPTAEVPLQAFTISVMGNIIVLSLTDDETRALPAIAYWDLQLQQDGRTSTLLAGQVRVVNDVTRVT